MAILCVGHSLILGVLLLLLQMVCYSLGMKMKMKMTIELTGCPKQKNGYIMQGDYDECECHCLGSSHHHEMLEIVDNSGNVTKDEKSPMHFPIKFANKDNLMSSYFCRLVGDTSKGLIIYTKYAYGPTGTSGKVLTKPPFHMCPSKTWSEPLAIEIICTVDLQTAVPGGQIFVDGLTLHPVTEHINLAKNSNLIEDRKLPKAANSYYFSIIPDFGGDLVARCNGANEMFSNVGDKFEMKMKIFSPPSDPPQITVNNFPTHDGDVVLEKDVSTVQGQEAAVKCIVDTGYPEPDNLVLKCGQRSTMSEHSIEVVLRVDFPLYHDSKIKCLCSASHATHCYDMSTSIFLGVKVEGASFGKCLLPSFVEILFGIFTGLFLAGALMD